MLEQGNNKRFSYSLGLDGGARGAVSAVRRRGSTRCWPKESKASSWTRVTGQCARPKPHDLQGKWCEFEANGLNHRVRYMTYYCNIYMIEYVHRCDILLYLLPNPGE